MSRHDISLPAGRTLTVGWDPPLQTFFGIVIAPDEDGPRLWVGSDPQAPLRGVDQLAAALGGYADYITADVAFRLADDHNENRA